MILSGVVLKNLPEGGVLINFNGHKVPVDLQNQPAKNQALTVRVETTHPATVLKVLDGGPQSTTSQAASQTQTDSVSTRLRPQGNATASALTQTDLRNLNLKEGQTLRVPIARVLDETTVITRIQQKNVVVHTDGARTLKPGQSLPVTVAGARQPGPLYFLVQSPGPVLQQVTPGQLKPYLPSLKPLGELLARLANFDPGQWSRLAELAPKAANGLKQTVQELLPGSGRVPDAAQLKAQIERSGLDYEARLKHALERGLTAENRAELAGNLKGRLLQLLRSLPQQTAGAQVEDPAAPNLHPDTRALLQKAVDSIELNQLSNQYARQENQPLLLQIPNPFAHGDPTIKLYLRPAGDGEGQGRNAKKHFNLVFLLDLSALGNLRVDSRVDAEGLAVTIFTENPDVARYINQRPEQFSAQMAELGFKATLTSQVRENVSLPVDEDFPQALIGDPSRLVDIRT